MTNLGKEAVRSGADEGHNRIGEKGRSDDWVEEGQRAHVDGRQEAGTATQQQMHNAQTHAQQQHTTERGKELVNWKIDDHQD